MSTMLEQQHRPAGDAIDAWIRGLDYDPRQLLAVQQDGATKALATEQERSNSGHAVVLVTKTRHSLARNLSDVAILQPAGVVFPGALLRADESLADGQPAPLGVPQGALVLSVDLPGLANARRTVQDPTHSTVQQAVSELLAEWHRVSAPEGYVNAARSYLEVKTAYTRQQVALELGFNAKWASGDASSQLDVNTDGRTSSVVACYKQVFYTVTVDTPARPSAVFAPAVSLEQLQQVTGARRPPAYVRSVDYGRVLMIRMETKAQDTRVNLQGALQQVSAGGVELGGSIDAKYAGIVRDATFTVVAIGGGAQTAAVFGGSEADLKRLREYIRKDATYRRDNPGAPISYTVAFLKDNAIAKLGFTTDYTETSSELLPNGYVKFRHEGGYIASFRASWEERDAHGNYHPAEQFNSGDVSMGWQQQVNVPGDARGLRLQAWAATGIGQWNQVFDIPLDGPSNKCYKVYGTIWGPAWNNDC